MTKPNLSACALKHGPANVTMSHGGTVCLKNGSAKARLF